MNYQLGTHAFLWTNPLQYKEQPSPDEPEAHAGWANWGGDKVWLAPQGWEREDQWPGPPDPVLDSGPFSLEVLREDEHAVRVRLTSEPDRRSGVRLSRVLSLEEGSTRLRLLSTMTNTGERTRRWGIWPVTQIDARSRTGDGWNTKLRVCVPLNPSSMHPLGHRVIYGSEDNPQLAVVDGVAEVSYMHRVGKIGVDCVAGWVATIDGETGNVLVQQMTFDPGVEYPDDASVEVWTNGLGTLAAYGETVDMPDDVERNPYMLECELVSPFAELAPGESFDFAYSWASTNIGADGAEVRRIRSCGDAGCEVEALQISEAGALNGRYGVFFEGECWIAFLDEDARPVAGPGWVATVSPLAPLVLAGQVTIPDGSRRAVLGVYGSGTSVSPDLGGWIGELARVSL